MWSALAELDMNEDFWPTMVSRLGDGEFLAALAKELKVNYSVLRNWIRGNKSRELAYAEAEKQGRHSRLERVIQRAYETATADIKEPTTRMEQLRAAEIMLRQHDASGDKPQTFGDITINFVQAKEGRTVEGEVLDRLP